MKLITYYHPYLDSHFYEHNKELEVILSPLVLSGSGEMSLIDLEKKFEELSSLGISLLLDWDILMTQNELEVAISYFEKLSHLGWKAVRVKDLGAADYIIKNTSFKIQFVSQIGNHNIAGLLAWQNHFGSRLESIALSPELPLAKIKEYKKHLHKIEVLALGPLLLFYTPRHLLQKYDGSEIIHAQATSEESPHSGFRLLENRHGHFMFHPKDMFLLDQINELSLVDSIKIDCRHIQDLELVKLIYSSIQLKDETLVEEIKRNYPYPFFKGYFHTNKSNIIFPKLKNKNLLKDQHYQGQVIGVEKEWGMIIHIENQIDTAQNFEIKNPNGKTFNLQVSDLICIDSENKMYKAMPIKGVLPKAIIRIKTDF